MENENKKEDLGNMFKGAPPESFATAEILRRKMIGAELKLWNELKGKKLNGIKFRRQHPIHKYIVDFYCHKFSLAIEVDGTYHNSKIQKQRDDLRTEELEGAGITVIRFTDDEVLENIKEVLDNIMRYINEIIAADVHSEISPQP